MDGLVIAGMFIVGFLTAFSFAMLNCDYYRFDGGHKYFKAFRAWTRYQKLLTKMRTTKDIEPWDMDKITYVGYVSSIITVILMTALIAVCSWLWITGKRDQVIFVFFSGTLFCCVINILGMILQGVDSLINRFFGKE